MSEQVRQWDIFEVSAPGTQEGNPFLDVTFGARFQFKHRAIQADGFYDGEGIYRVRCMPDTPGEWSYVTTSNCPALDGLHGSFVCIEPAANSHGPVRVHNTYHFAYADGTPHFSFGTTCYVWNHQGDELEEQTLRTLGAAPFNKMRMCVFPKHYDFNHNEPPFYPFAGSPEKGWDWTRFNPAFFRHLEQRVGNLRDLGIEADLILFHPYDRWGFGTMEAQTDDRYLRYVVARLAAYRNVWWSMANEYDLMKSKSMLDWDRFFRIVQECDPYQHLRSIHNCHEFYDHSKPWVTHQSIQRPNMEQVSLWRQQCRKPVVVDECRYEGNIHHGWGNITAQRLTHNFWQGVVRGGYVGHGETYVHPQDILWWSKGGALYGQSPARIAFLRQIIEAAPVKGLEPLPWGWDVACGGQEGHYYLVYWGEHQPLYWYMPLPAEGQYQIDLIDTWEMTISPLPGLFSGKTRIELPGKPYMAARARRVE